MQFYTPHSLLEIAQRTGRWTVIHLNQQDCLYTTNLGSYLRLNVNHTSTLQINFQSHHHPLSPGQVFAWRIDQRVGGWHRFLASQQTLKLPLSTGHHTIEVMTAGNTDLDAVWSGQDGFAITGIAIDDHGSLAPAPRRPVIDFIGDSITAGCWVNGRHAALDYRPESNYAAHCADLLNVDSVRIAYSAGGVLRPATGGVPVAKDFLPNINQQIGWHANHPALVCLNLGVNDRYFSPQQFSLAYQNFLHQVLTIFPESQIAVLTPFSQTFASEIKQIVAPTSATLIDTSKWCSSYTDGLHPDQAGSLLAGKYLAKALAPLLPGSV